MMNMTGLHLHALLIVRDAGDDGKPNVIEQHLHGPTMHEVMRSTSRFRLWITPIVTRLTETTHPAATLV